MTQNGKPDCLVVGGGLIGMLTARELQSAGLTVRVLDRQSAGREASWAGGGILSPLYPWRYTDPVTELAAWGQEYYPRLAQELAAETGIDPEWVESGLLVLGGEEQVQARTWAQHHGVRLELLDEPGIRRTEPALVETEQAALWLPDVAQIRNPRLMKALHRSLELRGVVVQEDAEVHSVVERDGQVVGVRTGACLLEAERVVVAGGAWTGDLLADLGVPVAVRPVRGQMILFHARPGLVNHIVLSRDRYLIPRRDGRILMGSTVEETGFDKSTTAAARKDLFRAAVQLVPELADYSIERHWAGLRPGTPDGVPYIGEHPRMPGLYVNAGHFRNGVVLGPASARLLADLLLERPPALDPAPFAVSEHRPAARQ
ncbi:MAG TPA: glycine oxidase ThiO [Gammaproteobacteria bacterium]|nr:glycine oxidase ThiO [Gammaproteobacteria bacterium]